MSVYENWSSFVDWADAEPAGDRTPWAESDLGVPVPRPPQVLAIGANYKDHAEEAGIPAPDDLIVFTKFVSSLAAPNATVSLTGDDVDYETEIVVVIGRGGHRIPRQDAWDHVAGIAVGQDYSDRAVQLRPPVPQFSLGKSYPNFGPFGPYVVTPDEFLDRDAISFSASLQRGQERIALQTGDTAQMFFPIAETVHRLSQIVTLLPGDILFTGTPAGVGKARGLMLRPGDRLTTVLDGFGSFTNEFLAAS
ncbi:MULTISPECIES: fumarylacetoacetate hydrolase family protein [unclassified Microbacterium]|uniref:fumarylacetoacetate hydrolase family protein n=1 Tax=unclassified Microbacterium TaxID=2609290 RepID=UPI00214BC176|nr:MULTISPECIES: fumarylacetoacetate hydrolase family protein [unclassified Microbacterium]MCR2783292.1 fumarylacetoacetate hydrolase family protein [Microbacterium sp. zg.B96]MDL5351924.1 fumarylacetoacetate hydrolase family protein [Microbacterium sp. zg-YB36]WIM15833.1 fumarylacetoacetate hydrolase family protein [Microbacterium sp. zg-B96]